MGIMGKIKVSNGKGVEKLGSTDIDLAKQDVLTGKAAMVRDEVVRRIENFKSVDQKLDHVLLKSHSLGEVEISHLNAKSEKYAAKVKKIAEALGALGERKEIKRKKTQ